jgi:hypothetical protein
MGESPNVDTWGDKNKSTLYCWRRVINSQDMPIVLINENSNFIRLVNIDDFLSEKQIALIEEIAEKCGLEINSERLKVIDPKQMNVYWLVSYISNLCGCITTTNHDSIYWSSENEDDGYLSFISIDFTENTLTLIDIEKYLGKNDVETIGHYAIDCGLTINILESQVQSDSSLN